MHAGVVFSKRPKLSLASAGVFADTNRFSGNTQSTLKEEQNQCKLQNCHRGIPCTLLDKTNISLTVGIALPNCGYNMSGWRGKRMVERLT